MGYNAMRAIVIAFSSRERRCRRVCVRTVELGESSRCRATGWWRMDAESGRFGVCQKGVMLWQKLLSHIRKGFERGINARSRYA